MKISENVKRKLRSAAASMLVALIVSSIIQTGPVRAEDKSTTLPTPIMNEPAHEYQNSDRLKVTGTIPAEINETSRVDVEFYDPADLKNPLVTVSLHKNELSGLAFEATAPDPLYDGTYAITSRVVDSAGSEIYGSYSNTIWITIDTVIPHKPYMVQDPWSSPDAHTIKLKWSQNDPNPTLTKTSLQETAPVTYAVYRENDRLGDTPEMTYVDNTIDRPGLWHYRIFAQDAAGNVSSSPLDIYAGTDNPLTKRIQTAPEISMAKISGDGKMVFYRINHESVTKFHNLLTDAVGSIQDPNGTAEVMDMDVSYNGQKLVYTTYATDGSQHVHLYQDSTFTDVTNSEPPALYVHMSSDGNRLLYTPQKKGISNRRYFV
ncbi:hypothetical protein [Gorillibacterium massiliense]|uniref:hypothetical protein n=1 Tax=Gorillibacterium massiliense TaxID=1280390 RepID=UPI0004BC3DE1|nr:hypothetical protein [Gorillibacterium massiliense]